MGLFGPDLPKRITAEEYKQAMQNLYGELDQREREEVTKLFRSDLLEVGLEAGISAAEYEAGIDWLKANPKLHVLETDDLEVVEKYFSQHLVD